MKDQSTDVLRKWQETSSFWGRYSDQIREMFMPLTDALIEDAGIVKGQSVLDVAGGSGEPSLTIARFVGANGSVTCTDAVSGMVDAARVQALKEEVTNIKFQQCTAESIPFEDNSFDVAVSRLGAMFFPDAHAALREMLRVVKPGGALAFAVWCANELNPFLSIPTEVVSRHVELPTAEPNALGAFRFAESGKLASILKDSGAIDVRERVFKFDLTSSLSVEEFWEFRSQVSETLRGKLAPLSDEVKTQIASEIYDRMEQFVVGNQMKIPAQILIVSGKKSQKPKAEQ